MDRAKMSETGGDGGDGDSRRRTAASMDSSSKGLRLCLTPAVMIAVFVGLTRGRIYMGHEGDGLVFFILFFISLLLAGGLREEGEGEKRGGGSGWTYGVVDYSFDGNENPERCRHDERCEV